MEKEEKEHNYGDKFSLGQIGIAVNDVEKSLDELINSYDTFFKKLDNLVIIANSDRYCLLPSEADFLIHYIENILIPRYKDYANDRVYYNSEKHTDALFTICSALKHQLKDKVNVEKTAEPDYLDFLNYIYDILSNRLTHEEKYHIENKCKELSDKIDDIVTCYDFAEGNPFSDMKY